MNLIFNSFVFILFLYTSEAAEIAINANELNRALPLKVKAPGGISDEPKVVDSGIVPNERKKERGWHNWNSPTWNEPESDGNSWSGEPSLQSFPNSWGKPEGKPCCGGKNGWGLPSLPETDNGWGDSTSDLLPLPQSEPEHSGGGGWDQSQWPSGAQSDDSSDDWSAPSLSPSQWNSNNKPCNCAAQKSNQPLNINYPNLPSGHGYPSPHYAPIRPLRQYRPQPQPSSWNHWDSMPWNSFEKGNKDNGAKEGDTEGTAEEVVKQEDSQESVNDSQSAEEVTDKTSMYKVIDSSAPVVLNHKKSVK